MWGVFNISKGSSWDAQRHGQVTGDAGSSVNSAGVRARNAITRCSRWQQWRSQSAQMYCICLITPADSPPPGPHQKHRVRYPMHPLSHVTHEGRSTRNQEKKWRILLLEVDGRSQEKMTSFWSLFLAVVSTPKCPWAKYFKPNCPQKT